MLHLRKIDLSFANQQQMLTIKGKLNTDVVLFGLDILASLKL
jgi:hypothetical protein